MARWFLAAAAVAWGVPGLVGLAVAIGGADAVVPRLPDLAIGDAALGRTVITLAFACLLVAAAHAAVADRQCGEQYGPTHRQPGLDRAGGAARQRCRGGTDPGDALEGLSLIHI